MEKDFTFEEFLENVCLRPQMWVPNGSFNNVFSLIMGYTIGNKATPLSGENWRNFNRYGCIKFGFPTNVVVSYVFKKCSKNDEDAINLFHETVNEFISLPKMTADEIIDHASKTFNQKN